MKKRVTHEAGPLLQPCVVVGEGYHERDLTLTEVQQCVTLTCKSNEQTSCEDPDAFVT